MFKYFFCYVGYKFFMGGFMTKEELVLALVDLSNNLDIEDAHANADQLLLEYINDPAVSVAFDALEKWYA